MIIFTAFLAYIAFQAVKNFQLRNLNVSLRKQDDEMVERLADMATSRRFLGDYTCDLYKLRARYMRGDTEKFEEMLAHMIAMTYKNPADKKSFLEQYYHVFLIRNNRAYAQMLLEGIRAMGDDLFTRYNEQAFAVMMDKRTDLIQEMVDEINQKQYYGFALGVILFMIAQQYASLGDTTNAVTYYENAKVCFRPDSIYIAVLEKALRDLHGKTEQSMPA